MSDVFVSYKAEDRRRVQPLVQALEADGLSVWWDAHLGGGDEWREAIMQHLDAARAVVVIWSSRSVGPGGDFVRDEASRAKRRGAYVPVRIDKVDPPLGFGETQANDLRRWRGDRSDQRYRAVLSSIQRKLRGEADPPAAPVAARGVDRRAVIAGSAAAISIAAVGAWELLKSSGASASSRIAVLPFANLSGDPNQAYFSDGIAEEIRSALARIEGLQVIGRTSSEAVRNEDAKIVARKLGVGNVLTGTVRQSAATVRIGAELVDGRSAVDKWSQEYYRSPGDAIQIEMDIAENVASAVSKAFRGLAREAVAAGGTLNAAAQDFYLKAGALSRADDSDTARNTVLGLYDSAIGLDPKFADAYAAKASLLAMIAQDTITQASQFKSALEKAAAVARQAVAIAPDAASGHGSLAQILSFQLDLGRAAAEAEKARLLAPGDPGVLVRCAALLATLRRTGEALKLIDQARSRDPLNPSVYSIQGYSLSVEGRWAEAEKAYRKTLALAPDRGIDRAALGRVLWRNGKADEARAQYRTFPADDFNRIVDLAVFAAHEGNREESDTLLRRMQQLNKDGGANIECAEIYAQRGEPDQAFAALDRAWAVRDPLLAEMDSDVWLQPLRNDARFSALLRKMNFPTA